MYVSDRWILLLTLQPSCPSGAASQPYNVVPKPCTPPSVAGVDNVFLFTLKPCSESVRGNMRTRGMHLACTRQLLVQCIYVLGHDMEVLEECIYAMPSKLRFELSSSCEFWVLSFEC